MNRPPFGRHRKSWFSPESGPSATGALFYRSAPDYWNQYAQEMKRAVAPAPHVPKVHDWPDTGLHAAWLGHSTVFIKVDGFLLITDPVFSVRAGLNVGVATIGAKRLVAPPVDLHELPRPDLILLSHAHMDHFDLPTLRRFRHRDTEVITATRTANLLRRDAYGSVTELGWNEERRVGPASVRAIEVNHWGARFRTDMYRGYNGYLIQIGRYQIFFGGDTANTAAFKKVGGSRQVDLALMPIGAYNPWLRFHCTPEESWRMADDARAEFFLPIHHSTFQLSREPLAEPLERLHTVAGSQHGRIALTQIGQEFSLS